MKRMRFISIMTFVTLFMMGCSNDIVIDDMETENVTTNARRKVQGTGEGNEPDTCAYWTWASLDTTIIEDPIEVTSFSFHITCNGGLLNALNPSASVIVNNIMINDLENNSTAIITRTEIGNNGQIHCYYHAHVLDYFRSMSLNAEYYDDYDDFVTAQMHQEENRIPEWPDGMN